MIKRIININNVGVFQDFNNGGSIQFEELTFIYGLNTRGKTTLTNIFSSLKENDPSLIINRRSIPLIESNQNVRISLRPPNATNELTCVYTNDRWQELDYNENLHIFGSDFIHKNLFTGLSIDRQNKENFTRFILGHQGVQLATQIAEDKRVLGQKKRQLPSLLPSYLRDKENEEYTIFFTIDPSLIELEESKENLLKLQQDLKLEKGRLEQPTIILEIPDITEFNVPANNLLELIAKTNALLEREFTEISANAIERLQEHIESNFNTTENAELWIKQGLDILRDNTENCLFCGQSLEGGDDLIKLYHLYFDEAYREYILDISNEIERLRRDWRGLSFNSLNVLLSEQNLLTQYNELIDTESFTSLTSELKKVLELTNESNLNDLSNQLSEQINLAFNEKKKKPQEKLETIDFSNIENSNSSYVSNLTLMSDIIEKIREEIQVFKEPYGNLTKINDKITELQIAIKAISKNIARVEQNDACVSYQREIEEINTIETRIAENEDLLSEDQNQYLDDFFERIDSYFKQFGSENFELEKGINNRGHQPVYFLKVKFKHVEINESDMVKIFSESDKRALALSLFWAKIDFLTDEQKQNAIIILDDPVTSFDDNRILKSITQIKDTLRNVNQVIVLTHYSHFIKNFMERGMNDDFTIAFLEIAQDNTTSFLRKIEGKFFTETTYERVFSNIHSFINRETEVDIRNDLRVFLESLYLPHFYVKEYKIYKNSNTSFSTLREKIDAIFDEGDIRNKFHYFRNMLNPESHIFTSNNEEDIRSFASEMMNYLYDFSYD